MTPPFWERPLAELTFDEWEALCDGCGRCCMHKFEDEESGEILHTDVACRLLDAASCRCRDYVHRLAAVPDCLDVRKLPSEHYHWLPATCAYRLRHEGRPLYDWHPLRSGDAASVHAAGISMRGRCLPESEVPEAEWEEHILPADDY